MSRIIKREGVVIEARQEIPRSGALAVMASRLSVDPSKLLASLKQTVFKDARTDEEIMNLCIVANEYGLNPFLKEIYAFTAKGGGVVPMVSIDGWIRIINAHSQLDGLEFSFHDDERGSPVSCTCTVYRKDRAHPTIATEYYSECHRATDPWKQMPRRMLRHKALIQASRIAFGFGGIFDEDEAQDILGRSQRPAIGRVVASEAVPEVSPLSQIRNLLKGAGVTEQQLCENQLIESLESMPEESLKELVARWGDVVGEILKGGAQ